MKLTTTFYSEEILEFQELMYINGTTQQVIFKTDLNDKWATYSFFKSVAKFVKSKLVRNSINNSYWRNQDYYQFAIMYQGKVCPIKWFNLVINEKVKVSHDIAFETTLIKKNGISIPFGLFPQWTKAKTLPKYREFNMKARAYNYMANQVKKSF